MVSVTASVCSKQLDFGLKKKQTHTLWKVLLIPAISLYQSVYKGWFSLYIA